MKIVPAHAPCNRFYEDIKTMDRARQGIDRNIAKCQPTQAGRKASRPV